eukprot:GHVS01068935.1.p1 GENE.GHVS01068935.1~~GHVS01068935.1.p1  ORF type:complete len:135 (+),score=38.44 GHVS01068935.1:137-541(+)
MFCFVSSVVIMPSNNKYMSRRQQPAASPLAPSPPHTPTAALPPPSLHPTPAAEISRPPTAFPSTKLSLFSPAFGENNPVIACSQSPPSATSHLPSLLPAPSVDLEIVDDLLGLATFEPGNSNSHKRLEAQCKKK